MALLWGRRLQLGLVYDGVAIIGSEFLPSVI